jgi:hypothetical protein
VSAPTDAALHVSLERDEDCFGVHRSVHQSARGEPHHDLRPAEQRPRIVVVEAGITEQ